MDTLSAINNIAQKKMKQDTKSSSKQQKTSGQHSSYRQKIFKEIKKYLVDHKLSLEPFQKVFADIQGEEVYLLIDRLIKTGQYDIEHLNNIIDIIKNIISESLSPQQKKLQQKLAELLEIFSQDIQGQDVSDVGENIENIFLERLKQPNEYFDHQKPIDQLYDIDQNFSIQEINMSKQNM